MLPIYLDCPFLIAPSIFSNVYLVCSSLGLILKTDITSGVVDPTYTHGFSVAKCLNFYIAYCGSLFGFYSLFVIVLSSTFYEPHRWCNG
jgi:hypothetical protein